MRAALVITDEDFYAGTGYAEVWERTLGELGWDVERIARVPPSWGSAGPEPGRYDLAVPHVLVEEVAVFGATMRAAAALELAGVPVLNPLSCVVASSDKLVTAAVWAAAGIPQPDVHDLADLTAWPRPGERMVLKPALCDGGRHVQLVDHLEQARAVVAGWRADEAAGGERRGAALLQEWVREPEVVRVFATPQEVSLAYVKTRPPGALVSGGRYVRVEAPSAAVAGLARRMVASLGGGLMGLDVLVEPDGRVLALEANAPFGFDVQDHEQGRWVARAAVARAGAAAAALAAGAAGR
ncbi:ATP-grasp domain-containing protein [Quadrisphaera sp. KR29]|uniref:ATP-grasp domain-containing protein n=1 Tax=Quadrisphaera sp. KR29 TaxID=3461391 RepID=UPI004044487B